MKIVETFAGSLALSAWATGASSLIGYMGGKRALAPAIADAVGLKRGDVEHVFCADAGPWGDFWAHFSEHGLAVAEHFEAKARDGLTMPELWREEVQHPPHAAPAPRLAQFLTLQSRTASATPIWSDGARWVMPSGHAREQRIFDAHQRGRHSVDVVPRSTEWNGQKISGLQSPETLARRIRSLHGAIAHRLTAHHGDTFALLDLLPADLTDHVVYLDPPYVGCTPYAAACSRDLVLELACARRHRPDLRGRAHAAGGLAHRRPRARAGGEAMDCQAAGRVADDESATREATRRAAHPLDRGGGMRPHLTTLNCGLGRDSIAMLCLLAERRLMVDGEYIGPEAVDAVLFSDTGAEWPHTYALLPRVAAWCAGLGLPFYHLRKPDDVVAACKRQVRPGWRPARDERRCKGCAQ